MLEGGSRNTRLIAAKLSEPDGTEVLPHLGSRKAVDAALRMAEAFEGFELTAKVTDTFLRGNRILENGKVIGEPTGRYLARPTS